MPTTYTLDADEEDVARQLMESGRFASIAEVVSEGIYRIAADEALAGMEPAALKRLMDEAEEGGMLDEEGEVTLDKLRQHFLDLAAAQRAKA